LKETEAPLPTKAMIVEDEVDLCYLLKSVLKQNNLQADCAYSIKEAKENINRINPAVIFLDNFLPDGYGSDFIVSIKKRFPAPKIIMITAHDSITDIENAFKRGADYFITKPFSAKTVKTTLDLMRRDGSKKII
jgi:two-component system, OmpR family, response regulator